VVETAWARVLPDPDGLNRSYETRRTLSTANRTDRRTLQSATSLDRHADCNA
jgi:hypothetical protein